MIREGLMEGLSVSPSWMTVSSDEKFSYFDTSNWICVCVLIDWLSKQDGKAWKTLQIAQKLYFKSHWDAAKRPKILLHHPRGSQVILWRVGWQWAQTWWLIFSHSGLPLCKLCSRVNKHIDPLIRCEVEHKEENKTPVHEGKGLIGKSERKRVLQAV